ncbi:acyltransferase [Azospirillum sp.]|uniref:acyltransferase family protein n=1 Tax=Azospirillum sp. TaxID=34012 RepID=UPI0026390E20|nr:acyltransferase [Azospirillum sp.]
MTASVSAVNYRANNLEFIRLCAATFVIVSHAFTLNGVPYDPYYAWTLHGSLSEIGIKTLFTVSGLLATRHWDDDPNALRFGLRIILRIMPGLAMVTLLCAFVMGPLVTTLPKGDYFASPLLPGFLSNILIYPIQYELPGVFTNTPVPGVVNGSLWVLAVEASLSLGVAILGTLGFLRWRFVPMTLFLGSIATRITLQKLHPTPIIWMWMDVHTLFDCGACFFAGASLCKFDTVLPRLPSVLFALLLLFVACMGTSALPVVTYFVLPYLIFCIAFEENKMTQMISEIGDLSYGVYIYAFPVQQLVVLMFGTAMGAILSMTLTTLLTFPLAALSWFLVERPMMSLNPFPRRKPAPPQLPILDVPPVAPPTTASVAAHTSATS